MRPLQKCFWILISSISICIIMGACAPKKTNMEVSFNINKKHWGTTADGKDVFLYTLDNGKGMQVTITNYGGIVTSLKVPDRNGVTADVVLGFDSLAPYLNEHPYFGALVGRYANRIAGGKFRLEGVDYKLAVNNGNNHLHGGVIGFDKVVWEATELKDTGRIGLQLKYFSKDGEEGYPGNLKVTVEYSLTKYNELKIDYSAETDKNTVINLSHHSYFNLAGGGDILQHELMIAADSYTVVNDQLIPTGELRKVAGTAFDFREPVKIGARIDSVDGGYDHNFVLNHSSGHYDLVATAYDNSSGRLLEVFTDQPGLQFYSGNFLDGSLTGKKGAVYNKHDGFCLETQHFPDSPNQAAFPSVVLHPGEKYSHHTAYHFSTR